MSTLVHLLYRHEIYTTTAKLLSVLQITYILRLYLLREYGMISITRMSDHIKDVSFLISTYINVSIDTDSNWSTKSIRGYTAVIYNPFQILHIAYDQAKTRNCPTKSTSLLIFADHSYQRAPNYKCSIEKIKKIETHMH